MDQYPQAAHFARCVFSTPITTVKVEPLFSVMNYNKSKSRCGMNDSTVVAVTQAKELSSPLGDPMSTLGAGVRAVFDDAKAIRHDLAPTHRR